VVEGLKALQAFPAQRELAMRLEGLFQADERIAGVILRGSVGRGDNDKFSDLDFTVAVVDDQLEAVLADREWFFRQAGNLAYWFLSATEHPRIFVGFYEGMVEVNAVYTRLTDVEPAPGEKGWVVLKDSTGWMGEVAAESARLAAERPSPVERADERFWLWAFRTAGRVQRGEYWHAWDMLNDIRVLLMDLLIEDAGRACLGFRQFPKLLSRSDERWLASTICRLDGPEILGALSSAVGLYTTLRARRGGQPVNQKLENQIRRMLQETTVHRHD